MRLKTNLSTRTYVNSRLINIVSVLLFLVLSVALLALVQGINGNAGELSRLQRETRSQEEKFKAAVPGVSEQKYQQLLKRIDFANGIIDRKSLNWLLLLDRLEATVPEGVALTTLTPEPGGQRIKITGMARNFRNLRQFVESLEASSFFTEVYLVSHAEDHSEELQKFTSFTISSKVDLK